jgi:RNA polymerase sigma factor (sigma-70 family)
MVFRAVWRQLGDQSHAAEDVTQSVFILLARKAENLRSHPSLAGWLHVAVVNQVRDYVRSEARRGWREREAARLKMNEPSASVEWSQLRPVIDASLSELCAEDREMVLLRFFHNRTLADIGAMFRVSEDAARMRLVRALDRLRGKLVRRGVVSTSAALVHALAGEAALAAPATGFAAIVATTALSPVAILGTTAAATAGALTFMSTIKPIAAGLAILAAAGWAGLEYAECAAARKRVDVARERVSVLQAAVNARNSEFIQAEVSRARAAAEEAERRAKVAEKREADAVAAGDAFLATHPEVMVALREVARANVAKEYSSFYVESGLPAELRRAFEDIVIGTGRAGDGISLNDRMSLRLRKTMPTDERDERIRAAIGDDFFAVFLRHEEVRSGRNDVVRLAGVLIDSEAPMTGEQAQSLRDVFVDVGKTKPADARLYWDTVIARAAAVLSPPQVEALGWLRARDELAFAQQEAARAELKQKAAGG